MFDLMQYALIFFDFQLILARMGGLRQGHPEMLEAVRWKRDSKPWRRSVSWKCRQRMPPAITASPRLVMPSQPYCTTPTSRSPRLSPSLARVCPRRKNSNKNALCNEFSYLTGF